MGSEMKGIHVTGVEVKDFRRITLARVGLVPGVGLVRVTGKNGAGKTSFISAIRAALGGAGEVHPESLGEGAEEGGEVKLALTNGFSVRRRLTEANPKGYLTVESPDGGKFNQSKVDEWLGATSFDPLALFSLPPKRQAEILLSCGEDPELPSKLDDIRAERKRTYTERTPWISQRQKASRVAKPEGERPEPIDVSAEMRLMGELQKAERERGDAFREAREARGRWENACTQVNVQQAHVEELERKLAQAREALQEREHERDRLEGDVEGLEGMAEALFDPSDEMDEVRARIEQADRVHEALEPWKEWERAQREVEEAKEKEAELTEAIQKLDAREAKLIQEAGIPVEGLSFTNEGAPLLNGRPLELASGAERCTLAVRVAMAVNPELRLCLLDEEANGLDLESLESLDALAKEEDFQIWCVRLGLEGDGEVVVVDGKAWDRGKEEPEEAEGEVAEEVEF